MYGQSHQNPLDLDLISLRAGDDEGGSLSPEDFEEAENADYSKQEDHDEDGNAGLFEGDIQLNEEDRTAMDNGISLREVVGSRKWPNVDGIVKVPYTFPRGLSSSRRRDIARVVQEFEEKTCIRC